MSTEIRNTLFPNFSMVQKVNFNFDPANEQIVFVFLVPMFLLRGVTSQDLQPVGEARETIHSTFTLHCKYHQKHRQENDHIPLGLFRLAVLWV